MLYLIKIHFSSQQMGKGLSHIISHYRLGLLQLYFQMSNQTKKNVISLINYLELHCKNMGWEINEKEEN